jgi:hypothetical protein
MRALVESVGVWDRGIDSWGWTAFLANGQPYTTSEQTYWTQEEATAAAQAIYGEEIVGVHDGPDPREHEFPGGS